MEKLLTVSIAAYNVEKYLKQTLDSLLIEQLDKIEVLIIVDGSKDKTLDIAKEYEKRYPNTFRAIYKENGGYGSTINKGIELASGKYFKQLDGDDWFDTKNLEKIIEKLGDINKDIIYTPYVKYYEIDKREEIIKDIAIKEYKDLNDALKNAKRLQMHSLMFKTEILNSNNIKIDEKCFYTDTEYVIFPLIYSESIETLDLPLYYYRFGMEGQSMSISGKKKHYMDHLRMSKHLLDESTKMNNVGLDKKNYINMYIAQIENTNIASFMFLLDSTKETFKQILKIDEDIKNTNISIYNLMPKYAKTIKILRTKSYFLYRLLYKYKNIKRDN